MVNVECPGCSAPYSVSEKRIPAGGLKMRCPKCGTSFMVEDPQGAPAQEPARRPPPKPTLPGHVPGRGLAGRQQSDGRTLRSVGAPPPPPTKKPIFSRTVDVESAAPASSEPIPEMGGGEDLSVDGLFQAAEQAALDGPPARKTSDGHAAPDAGGFDEGGFGVLDLPLPAMDRNTVAGGGMGGADLPVPAAGPDDLPMAAGMGDDLPMPAGMGAGLPMAAGGHDDLPMPAGEFDLPMPAGGHDDLPMPADEFDLPMPASMGTDLPLPATDGSDLPMPADGAANLPMASAGNLPMASAGLPSPGGQMPMRGGKLPEVVDGNGSEPTAIKTLGGGISQFGGADLDDELPPPPHGATAPFGTAGMDEAFLAEGAFPGASPDDSGGLPRPPTLSGDDFSAELEADRPAPPKAPAPPKRERGDAVGGEFDIDQVEHATVDGTRLPPTDLDEPEQRGEEEDEDGAPLVKLKKRRRKLRIALAVVPLLAIGGGALSLTPMGPYGYYAISDALNASNYRDALTSFRNDARPKLGMDTSAEAEAIMNRARTTQTQMARFAPMKAYTAHLAFVNSLRFGAHSENDAVGKQLLESLADQDASPLILLARAGRMAVDGKLDSALPQLESLASQNASDIDIASMAAEVALKAKKAKKALTLWKAAAKIEKSARTRYGLARALLTNGQTAEAIKIAQEVLALSKNHAGARTLLAKTLWQNNKTEDEAVVLLKEVTNKGPIRSAASSSELVAALNMLGHVHLIHARISAAEKAFKAALKIEPQSLPALVGNGEQLFISGRYAEAVASFEAAARVAPKDLTAAIGIAKVMLAQERVKEALKALLALAKKNKDPLIGFWLGRAYLRKGKRKLAEAAYRQAIKDGGTKPGAISAYVALADLLGSLDRTPEADALLALASAKLPNSINLHIAKGDVALKSGKLDEAQAEFVAALAIDEENLAAQFKLGVAHSRKRDFGTAAKMFDKVGEHDANYPDLALERAIIYEETGQTKKALKMLEDAVKAHPNNDDLKLRFGSILVISGQARNAVKWLFQVYGNRRTSPEVNHFLGRAYLLDNEPTKALSFLKSAARTDPNRAEYHLYLGWAANNAGQLAEAEKAINKALALDKNLADAYWQRGVLLQKQGKIDQSLEDLKIALEKRPSRYQAHAAMAVCFQQQTDWTAAEEAWRKAIDKNDKVPEWRYRLGMILLTHRNQSDAAAKHLLAAVDQVDKMLETKKLRSTPPWLWQANYNLGQALRNSDKKRALKAFKAYYDHVTPDDAYRKDAKQAILDLGGRP